MVADVEGHRLDNHAKRLGSCRRANSREEAATHHAHMSSVPPTAPIATVVVAAAGGRGHGMRKVVAVVHVAVVHRVRVCSHKTKQGAVQNLSKRPTATPSKTTEV